MNLERGKSIFTLEFLNLFILFRKEWFRLLVFFFLVSLSLFIFLFYFPSFPLFLQAVYTCT
jgi:hypothetical protein